MIDVAGHRDRQLLAARARAVEDRAQVLAVHVLERDEVAVVDLAEVEDLGDVRVRELHGDLRLVDEHRDELFVLRDARQDALDRHHALEALHAGGLRLEDLRHAADVDALEQVVLAERDGLSQTGPRLRTVGCVGVLRGPPRNVRPDAAGFLGVAWNPGAKAAVPR